MFLYFPSFLYEPHVLSKVGLEPLSVTTHTNLLTHPPFEPSGLGPGTLAIGGQSIYQHTFQLYSHIFLLRNCNGYRSLSVLSICHRSLPLISILCEPVCGLWYDALPQLQEWADESFVLPLLQHGASRSLYMQIPLQQIRLREESVYRGSAGQQGYSVRAPQG